MAKTQSSGKCAFCGKTFLKGSIKRHLNSCSERQAAVEKATQNPMKKPVKHFHLQVEGKDTPEYWLHLGMPVTTTLDDLDQFLRAIWLECCGHLSAFQIDGASYDSEPDDDAPSMLLVDEDDEPDFELPEGKIIQVDFQNKQRIDPPQFESNEEAFISGMIGSNDLTKLSATAFLQKFVEGFNQRMGLGSLPGANVLGNLLVDHVRQQRPELDLEKMTAEELMTELGSVEMPLGIPFLLEDEIAGGEMGEFTLGEVLTVGKKFTHEYDFGFTTYLTLSVVDEYEAPAFDEMHADFDPVAILARNDLPEYTCINCGKPAVWASGGIWLPEEFFCTACARQLAEGEMLLPIVNSPRMGMCGYTGDADQNLFGELYGDPE